MNDSKSTVSVTRYVLGALVAVIFFNFVLRTVLKLEGVPVTLGIAGTVGALLAWWFAKVVRRPPTSQERSRILWLYGGILATLWVAFIFLVSMKATPSVPGLLIVLIHYLPYPAFAQMFFSEKYFVSYFLK